MMRFNGFGHGFGGGYGCPFFGMTGYWGMGLFLLAVVVLLVIVFKKSKKSTGGQTALESLDMRFASGEITEEEYLQRKRILKGK